MAKRLYVGNLPHEMGDSDLKEVFEAHGEVTTAQVIMDRETNRSRGFGFVEMEDGGADAAIAALNNTSFGGRTLRVSLARQREGGPRGGGGGGDRDNRW